MKTHEQTNQSQGRSTAEPNTLPTHDNAARELYEGIIQLVARYASQERSRAVRDGIARRRERLRQAKEKEAR